MARLKRSAGFDLDEAVIEGRRAADQEGWGERIDHLLAWFERFAYLVPGMFQLCAGRVYYAVTLQNSRDHTF
jgi:hypothetical protein